MLEPNTEDVYFWNLHVQRYVPRYLFLDRLLILSVTEARKWFALSSFLVAPVLLLINAPFGRFTPNNQSSLFLFNGIKSWIIMELVSPIAFIYTFVTSPLTIQVPPLPSFSEPQTILAVCYLLHYANRALLSPLRTPSRSKTHIIVPVIAVFFNVINGSLMGSFLSSPDARMYHQSRPRSSFYVGMGLWALGLIGNIWHDEILLDIRRKARSKGKSKENGSAKGEHYAIPQGGLYSLISYPNYFCEWVEWFGFALAASPIPFELSASNPSALFASLLDPQTYIHIIVTPGQQFAQSLSPPWIFLISEVLLMLPRAYRGHQWYHNTFGASYPQNRKAVIPFVL